MKYKVNVLLISHESMLRKTFHDLLEKDCNVYDADDETMALDVISRVTVDIVLISIYGDNADNISLIKKIKSNPDSANAAIMVLGDQNKPDELMNAVHLGALYTFVYPLNLSYLKDIVVNVIDTFMEQRQRLIGEKEEYKNHLRSFLDASPGGMVSVIKTDKYYINKLSEKTMKFLGFGNAEVTGAMISLEDYTHPDDWAILLDILDRQIIVKKIARTTMRLKKSDDTYIPMEITIKEIDDGTGIRKFDFINYYIADSSDREIYLQHEIEEYQQKIKVDALTEIYNRETFYQETSKMIEDNPDISYIIGVFNIDRFKSVNEVFGTAIGDKLICEFADCLRDILDDGSSTFGRLESDHFAFCVPTKKFELLEPTLDSILEGKYEWNSLNYQMFLHVGLYRIENRDNDITLCCDRANMALQLIKENFVYRKRFFSNDMRDSIVLEQEIMRSADKAIENREFYVVFQPIVDVKTKEIVAAEALVRWKREDGTIVSPGDFIPVFEHNGYVSKLDMYVWDEVCRFQSERLKAGESVVPVSVNLSRIDFYNPNLYDELIGIVEKYNLSSEYLKVEITESAYMDQPQELLGLISNFKNYGFKVLMDDFGSGYSSLNMLKDVSVDVLKIDMRFMDTIDTSERASNILFSIIQMAKAIHMEIVAEGVETGNQYNLLLGMDCDCIQGYYFYKPLPENEFAEKLSENSRNMSTSGLETHPSIMYLTSGNEGNDFIASLGDEFSIHRVSNSEEAVEYLKRSASMTGLCVADFDNAHDEAVKFVMHMRGNTFYSDVPVMAVVSAASAEETMGDYIGNGVVDSIGRPLHPAILRQRIRNTINYNDIMLEKRAVSILQKNVQLRQQMNTFFEDSVAGITKIILDNSESLKVKEVVYANRRFLEMHDISLDEISDVAYLRRFFRNGITSDVDRLMYAIKKAILDKAGKLDKEYRIEHNDGTITNVLMIGTIRYRGSEVIFDMIFAENKLEAEMRMNAVLNFVGKTVEDAKGIHLWRYYPEEDAVEYYKRGMNGDSPRTIIHNAVENAVAQVDYCPEAALEVRDFYKKFDKGEEFVSTRIHVTVPEGDTKRTERWIKMTGQRVEDDEMGAFVVGVTENISGEVAKRRKRFRSKLYSSMINAMYSFYLEIDLDNGKIVSENINDILDKFNLPYGVKYDQILDLFAITVDQDDVEKIKMLFSRKSLLSRYESGENTVSFDFMSSVNEGAGFRWLTMSMNMYKDEETGRMFGAWGIMNTNEYHTGAENKLIAEHDSLTGLYNRAMLEKLTDKRISISQPSEESEAAFAIIDIDNFKQINEAFGHSFGDSILKTYSELITKNFPNSAIIGRLGGDEFGMFISPVIDRKVFETTLDKLKNDSRMTLSDNGKVIEITISVGVVYSNKYGDNFHKLYSKANNAMLISKGSGKDKYTVYEDV